MVLQMQVPLNFIPEFKKQSMKHITYILIFSLFSTIVFGQYEIEGRIADSLNGQPVESAYITDLHDPDVYTFSDMNGNFRLNLKNSESGILISHIGYKRLMVRSKGQRNFTVYMQPDEVQLKDVVIQQQSIQGNFRNLARIDLGLKPVNNAQELMRIVPGLFLAQHAGGGKAEQIFLRGFDIDHGTDIRITVDGMPVNMVSHAHGQGYADAHFIIPETIATIDYGTGPYYTDQGNLNTAGYIQFKTAKTLPQSRVTQEVGRYNTYRTLVMADLLKNKKDRQSAYLAGEYYYTDGPTINKQHLNRINLFGKYNRELSQNTSVTLTASAFNSTWDASGQVPDRAVKNGTISRFGSIDPSEGGETYRYNAAIQFTHRIKNGIWESQAFYSKYRFNLYSNFTFFLEDSINGDAIQQEELRDIAGISSSLHTTFSSGGWSFRNTLGVGIRYDAVDQSTLAHVKQRAFLGFKQLGDINESNSFAYVQQQASYGKWTMEGGIRFDYLHFAYSDHLMQTQRTVVGKSILSPKLNINYTFSPVVQAYLKGGKGFHSNDSRVVTANNGLDILPAAWGADAGVYLKPAENLLINIAAWYLYLEQEFVYVGDAGIIEPSGKTRRQGIDVSARLQLSRQLYTTINLNMTKARAIGEAKGSDYIPLAPAFTSTGGLYYKEKSGFNGSLSYRYIKDRPANEDNSIEAKGYLMLDASLNYTRRVFEIGIAVENLLNTEWNEAQFATTSRLQDEPGPVTELHYTPGTPFFFKLRMTFFF